ncbi:MAG: hypothetical protein C0622_10965 [Desulfuromonas sp.]|nr:MAG: hypothetical protein C0622_10965 [Desulfuromonas sp.]
MLRRKYLPLLLALILGWCGTTWAKTTFTSLANPNVYPIFIILDQHYLDGDFIPARGGVASLMALLKSGDADVTVLNHEPAVNMAQQQGWQLLEPTIVRAVHLLSYPPVSSKADIEKLKIVSAFPGGTPDKLFRAGHFANEPKFTDLFLAIQLFLNREFDALLLPEPHISKVADLLQARGDNFHISDIQLLTLSSEATPLNAGVARPDVDRATVEQAFAAACTFIKRNPEQAAAIIAKGYDSYFRMPLPEAAVLEALQSGRLMFATEVGH